MLRLWADNMVISGLQKDFCDNLKMLVSISKLAVREVLVRFLNIKIQRTEDEIMLSQKRLCSKIVREV